MENPKPKVKMKKRGMATITKTVTKGVNDKGKKFRTVEKITYNPMDAKLATTTKTRTGGLFGKTEKSGSTTRIKPYRKTLYMNPEMGYKVAKGEQKNLVKSGKKQAKIIKELTAPKRKIAMKKKLIMNKETKFVPSYL